MSVGRLALVLGAMVACNLPDLSTTGALRCGENGLCPPDFTCSLGRCCPRGSSDPACPVFPPGSVGSPCTIARDCTFSQGSICLPTPEGYCTARCALGDATCGEFGLCLAGLINGRPGCVRRCELPEGMSVTACRGERPAGGSQYICGRVRQMSAACLPNSRCGSTGCPGGYNCLRFGEGDEGFCLRSCALLGNPCPDPADMCSPSRNGFVCIPRAFLQP